MNIYEKLSAVQQELKAPKDKYNSFGEYKYRSLEGIAEAVKPVLAKYNCTIYITDEVVEIGGELTIKATAHFVDVEQAPEMSMDSRGITFTKAMLEATAYAGITNEKKKLDRSQLYGVASSYARKYAMNGLLLIDDTKDADTDEYAKQTQDKNTPEKAPNSPDKPSEPKKRATDPQIKTIRILAEKAGLNIDTITKKPLDMFTPEEATKLMLELRKKVPSEA